MSTMLIWHSAALATGYHWAIVSAATRLFECAKQILHGLDYP